MPTLLRAEFIRDALRSLSGWSGDTAGIGRTFHLDAGDYGEFVERLKVCTDALRHQPHVRRVGTLTQIWLCTDEQGGVTESDIALAARINYILGVVAGRAGTA